MIGSEWRIYPRFDMTRPTLCNNYFDFSVVLCLIIHICNVLIPIIKLNKFIPLSYLLANLWLPFMLSSSTLKWRESIIPSIA